jgi:hypothetical protein
MLLFFRLLLDDVWLLVEGRLLVESHGHNDICVTIVRFEQG